MKNLTLAVEEEVLEAARKYAVANKTTVNGLVRDYLTKLATQDDRAAKARQRLRELSQSPRSILAPGNGIGKICMIVECFLDTNILLYAASRNPMEETKKKIAVDIIDSKFFGISAQVAQEFYSVATRKAAIKLPADKALEWLENLEEFPCLSVDMRLVKAAVVICSRYRISFWDSTIIAAAEAMGAPIVYTEDLNHGQSYGEVQAVNPFRDVFPIPGFHERDQAPFE